MANNRGEINDRERRKALITKLATRIGMARCQAAFRHLGEHEWARLDRLQLQLNELQQEAALI
jgi:pyruvate/oxaloacetate carboxyltransferase